MAVNKIRNFAGLSFVGLLSIFNSGSVAAACGTHLSLAFLTPTPSFVAYAGQAQRIRLEACNDWWATEHTANFSNGEVPLVLKWEDPNVDTGIHTNMWKPTTLGPVTLTVSATDPYNASSTASASVSGEVRPRFYTIESTPFRWVDATLGIKQPPVVRYPIAAVPIGFTFNYYGVPYTSLAIGDNKGALVMGGDWVTWSTQTSLPDPAQPNNIIAPYWDDGFYGGSVYTLLDGNAPNRRFTISWVDVKYLDCEYCPPNSPGTFQVTLYEGSNDIVFNYLDLDFYAPPSFTTIGVENSDGTQASLFYTETSVLREGHLPVSQTSLRFLPPAAGATNQKPSANAGPDQSINEGATATLTGSGTDADGTISGYAWSQIAGPAVSLTNPTSAIAKFVAPQVTADVVLTFQLKVTDNKGASAIDSVNVTVRNVANKAPTANAGPDQSVKEKTIVTLNGLGSSDADGSIASYSWRQVSGKTVTLQSASTSKPTFAAPSVDSTTKLIFELTVKDNVGATASDQVVITVLDN